MEKKCFKCEKILPLSEFYKHPRMADGHINKCIDCCKAESRQNRWDKVDYYRAYDQNRNSEPHRIALRRSFLIRQNNLEPQKYHARTAANNALRDGILKKPDKCYFCSASENLEMHHPDYSQPLRVYWLCRICHRKLDNMEKLGINTSPDFCEVSTITTP